MKKKAAKKTKKKAANKKPKRSPPRNPKALTVKQIRAELDADDAVWSWCLEQEIPKNKNGTFDIVTVAAWLLKKSGTRRGLVYD